MVRRRTERLKIVFALTSPRTEIPSAAEQIRLQPATGAVGPLNAARLLVDRLNAGGFSTDISVGDKKLSAVSFLGSIEKKGFWGSAETSEFAFQYGVAGGFSHCFVTIEEKAPNAAGKWDTWAEYFFTLDGFVQAWIADREYSYWQNVKDPNEYKIAARSMAHLRTKSNGLPPPVERLEIDLSQHPGREILRLGFVEAVGATMWLGEEFWQRVGYSKRERLSSMAGLDVIAPIPQVLKIQGATCSFNSEETSELQDRLRAALYF